jgi:EpsI family protein
VKAAAQITIKTGVSYALLIQAGMVGVLAALFHASVVPPLVIEWYEHENFSYGFLIPLIVIYLVFQEREALKLEKLTPAFWGLVSLTGAIALGLLGFALGEPFLSRLSLVFTVAALVHVFAGVGILKRLAFPLVYLFLMVPPPYVIVKPVSYYLKMFDAVVAAEALQLIGIPLYRDSYFLHLPSITLEVADVCSGIASLFATVALGTLYVYFLPARASAKLAVLAGVVIFPLIANLIRIILVGASVYYYGPVMLKAFFHSFTGTFTFLLSLTMLLVLGEFLRRRYPVEEKTTPSKKPAMGGEKRETLGIELNGKVSASLLMAGAVLLMALYVSRSMASPQPLHLRQDLDALPTQLGQFRATPGIWPDAYADPEAEKMVSRLYQAQEAPIELFVGYRGSQYGAQRLGSPKLVFPTGWEYSSTQNVHIAGPRGRYADAVWLLTKKSSSRRLVLFWYQLPGKALSSDVLYRLELARRSIFHGRTDAAVVRLATELDSSESVDQALQRLMIFSQQLFPYVQLSLPEA